MHQFKSVETLKWDGVILLRVKFPFIRTVGPIKSELDVYFRDILKQTLLAQSNLLPGSFLVLVYISQAFEFLMVI